MDTSEQQDRIEQLEVRTEKLEARIALLEAGVVQPFIEPSYPVEPSWPQPTYPGYRPSHTWDDSSTSAVRIEDIPDRQWYYTVTRNLTVIDGELFQVSPESPPGFAPLPADAGILHVR